MDHFFQDRSIFTRKDWFSAQELYRRQVGRVGDGAKFVEVGCYEGRSAAFMAVEIENSGKDIEFCCVDLWENAPITQPLVGFDIFKANLAPVWHRITRCHREDSALAARHFANESLDFVFLDASHDEESVFADIGAWRNKVKRGGVIAGDDLLWLSKDWNQRGPKPYFSVKSAVERHWRSYEVIVENGWAVWWKCID